MATQLSGGGWNLHSRPFSQERTTTRLDDGWEWCLIGRKSCIIHNHIQHYAFVVYRSGIGGKSFADWATNTIYRNSIKWRIWLIFTLPSTVDWLTVYSRLPLKLTAWNSGSTKYDRFGWKRSSRSPSMCLTVLRSLVRVRFCFELVVSVISSIVKLLFMFFVSVFVC